jgi:amidohydrolase
MALKDAVIRGVDDLGDRLEALSHRIHGHPELAHEEFEACRWLSEFLAASGFRVETAPGGVATAFRATLDTGPGPTIAILCEYDALPGIGHACGHNVIAAAGAGAGAALAALWRELPPGRVVVLGTPAEESHGGKAELIRAGVFDGIDCAMMVHGFDRTVLQPRFLGIACVMLEHTSPAARGGPEPRLAVNALDACVQTYLAVAMLRQQMRPDCRIHGIVTDGGTAGELPPERAGSTYYVRAPRLDAMWELYGRVVACAEGAALATGTAVAITREDHVYEPLSTNTVMLDLFRANLGALALGEDEAPPGAIGSSDIGNVSQVVPAIHPMIAIAPRGTAIHTREFAAAAAGPAARAGLLAGAKAMAMTALDLLAEPARVQQARAELARSARQGPP